MGALGRFPGRLLSRPCSTSSKAHAQQVWRWYPHTTWTHRPHPGAFPHDQPADNTRYVFRLGSHAKRFRGIIFGLVPTTTHREIPRGDPSRQIHIRRELRRMFIIRWLFGYGGGLGGLGTIPRMTRQPAGPLAAATGPAKVPARDRRTGAHITFFISYNFAITS